jgi:glycosyltransferase involved in cell wall biosynthesis
MTVSAPRRPRQRPAAQQGGRSFGVCSRSARDPNAKDSTILPVPISVVIPVKDDARLLERCLAALGAQTVRPLEVIVVDNGSVDDSRDVALAHGARLLDEPSPGIAAASSTGYDAAIGAVIARCDADTVPPPDWLQRIAVAFAADPELAALTGPGRFYGVSRAAAAIGAVLYMRGYFASMTLALGHPPLFGSNAAFLASAWRAVRSDVHRHDLGMHDDVDLSVHLGPNRRIRYDRRLVVDVSGRPLVDAAGMGLRARRGVRSIVAHWPEQLPPYRWQARITAGLRRLRGGRP